MHEFRLYLKCNLPIVLFFFPLTVISFLRDESYVYNLETYISKLETYVPKLETYISKLET